uniref:C2H2-type domain-containing protein n=1 Tax=Caenorhabditis japonica TaxID=281687 RepID=A0A8R1HUD3_CAEJA
MNNSTVMGNELLFEDDPFISGGISEEHNDQLFPDIFEDSLAFNTGIYEENNLYQPNDLGYNFEYNSLQDIDASAPPDAYVTDGDYHEPEPNLHNMELMKEDSSRRLGEVIEEVAAAPPTAPKLSKKKAAPKVNSIPGPSEPPGRDDLMAPELPSKLRYAAARAPARAPAKKPRTLYPVKVRRMIPPQTARSGGCVPRSSPYALTPVPPRYPPLPTTSTSSDSENRPFSKTDTTTEQRAACAKKGISVLIPRDHPSNQIRCLQCHSAFTSQLALEFHEVERHTNAFAFQCRHCPNIYANIAEANKHIIAVHRKDTIPLLDSSICGNGDITERGKKGSQRRISGMIWSFLSNHLAQAGKLSGTREDNEIVKKEVKALFNPANEMKKTELLNQSGNLLDSSICKKVGIEDSASINDLLKQQYIYGPSIVRMSINSVAPEKIIRPRYIDTTSPRKSFLPYFYETEKLKSKPPLAVASSSTTLATQAEPVQKIVNSPNVFKKAILVQHKPAQPGGESKPLKLGSVYLSKSPQGVFVISEKANIKRNATRTDPITGKKMIKVELMKSIAIFEKYAKIRADLMERTC